MAKVHAFEHQLLLEQHSRATQQLREKEETIRAATNCCLRVHLSTRYPSGGQGVTELHSIYGREVI